MNNNWWCENIRATNPCGEQPLPPYGSCLLGSVNLTRFVRRPFTTEAEFDWEEYREVVRANLDSAFFTLGAFVKGCLDAKQPGAAVLVSSVVARIGVLNHEAIAAAKAGVEGLVRSAAATYAAKGLRVNAIAPGILRTPATERLFAGPAAEQGIAAQYPIGRYGLASDAAGAIVWLLSDDTSWVTGQVLSVDGGFTAVRPMVRAVAAP